MSRILLIRHGDAVGAQGKFHGLPDNPLTDAGRKEAADSVDDVAQFEPKVLYHSPLSRAAETADIISKKLGLPMVSSQALLPLDLGNFVGKPTDESTTEDVRHYLEHPDERIPGGGTVNQWANNYLPFFHQIRNNGKNDTVGFVTHGRNIVLSNAALKGQPYDKGTLVNNTQSTEHGGYAVVDGNKFKILTPRKVPAGQS